MTACGTIHFGKSMIRTETSYYPTYAESHPGMSGKNNEDRFAVSAFRTGEEGTTPALLAVLCDGIGGHRAGEVAAEMAVNIISQKVSESDGTLPIHVLDDAVKTASNQIYIASREDPERSGMGATCACAWLIGNHLYTACVGDSRIYHLRGDRIQQISIDHTWVQEALEAGIIQPEEAEGHPNAHVIRRYLGSEQPPLVDHRLRLSGHETDDDAEANQGILLHPGDRLLICTDGLSDLVENSRILEAIQDGDSSQAAIHELISLANLRGGHDNITIILIEIPHSAPKPAMSRKRRFARSFLWAVAILLAAGLLAALAWGSLRLINRTHEDQATHVPTAGNLPAVDALTPQQGSATRENLAEGSALPTPGATVEPALPSMLDNGATITPWPTNTPILQTPPADTTTG